MLDAFCSTPPLPGAGVSIMSPFSASVNLASEIHPGVLAGAFNKAATELSAGSVDVLSSVLQCEPILAPRRAAREKQEKRAEGQKSRQVALFEQATGRAESDASSSAGGSDGQGAGAGVILTAPAMGWAASEEAAKTTDDALKARPVGADTF